MIINNCKKIVGGSGEGLALVTTQPINFLTMVDVRSGIITDPKHELYEKSIKGVVLCFPHSVGSSVGAYAIYSLGEYHTGPSAVVCIKADITTASGCAIAKIPVVDLPQGAPAIVQGALTRVEADTGTIKVKV